MESKYMATRVFKIKIKICVARSTENYIGIFLYIRELAITTFSLCEKWSISLQTSR